MRTPRKLRQLRNWLTGRTPGTGDVRFGDLRRHEPFCRDYGYNRGLPVDRYYIEAFLKQHGPDIRGTVLEIGERAYTKQFGTDVGESHMLHYSDPTDATYVDDLTTGALVPDNLYDCIIFTQTLHLIYDMPAALRTLRRILKPGGVLLCTAPGITQISDNEWNPTWYWSLSSYSTARLFGDVFGEGAFDTEVYGNLLAATSFLYGLGWHELTTAELDVRDHDYQVIIGVAARKPAAMPG